MPSPVVRSSSRHAAALAVAAGALSSLAAAATGYEVAVAAAAAAAALALALAPLLAGLRRLPSPAVGMGVADAQPRRARRTRVRLSAPLPADAERAAALLARLPLGRMHALGTPAAAWCAALLGASRAARQRRMELRVAVAHRLPKGHPDEHAAPAAQAQAQAPEKQTQDAPPSGGGGFAGGSEPGPLPERADGGGDAGTPNGTPEARPEAPLTLEALAALLESDSEVPLVSVALVQVIRDPEAAEAAGVKLPSRGATAIALLEVPLLHLSGVFVDTAALGSEAKAADLLPRMARGVLEALPALCACAVRAPVTQADAAWPMAPSAYALPAMVKAGMRPLPALCQPTAAMPVGPRAAGVQARRDGAATIPAEVDGAPPVALRALGGTPSQCRRVRRALSAFVTAGGVVRWEAPEGADARRLRARSLARMLEATLEASDGADAVQGDGSETPAPAHPPAALARAWEVDATFFEAIMRLPASSQLRVVVAECAGGQPAAFAIALGRGAAEPWTGREGPLALRMGAADPFHSSPAEAAALTALLCDAAAKLGPEGFWGEPSTGGAVDGGASKVAPIDAESWYVDTGCGGYARKRALRCERVESHMYALFDRGGRPAGGAQRVLPQVATALPEWSVPAESDELRNRREAREVIHQHREREFYRVGGGLGAGMSRRHIRREVRRRRRQVARQTARMPAQARARDGRDVGAAARLRASLGLLEGDSSSDDEIDSGDEFADVVDVPSQAYIRKTTPERNTAKSVVEAEVLAALRSAEQIMEVHDNAAFEDAVDAEDAEQAGDDVDADEFHEFD